MNQSKKAVFIPSDYRSQSREISPENGESFTLAELNEFVGGHVEMITFPSGRMIVINEEGKLNGLPVNYFATKEWLKEFPPEQYQPEDFVVGDAIICDREMVK